MRKIWKLHEDCVNWFGILYSACFNSIILYRSETCPVKEEDVIKLDRKSAFLSGALSLSLLAQLYAQILETTYVIPKSQKLSL